ncbi:MAG: hypothetical protein ACO3ZY_08475, partial [Phycisphaerales bacterium]
ATAVRAGGGAGQVGGLRPAVQEGFRRSRLEELFEIVHELEVLEAMLAELESGGTPTSEP